MNYMKRAQGVFLKQHYTKSSSSAITKTLFTLAPIAGAFALPTFKFLDRTFNNGVTNTAGFESALKYINPISYDSTKDILDNQNLQHIGLGAFNLMLVSQSLHSCKNLYTKYQQEGVKKVLPIEINGWQTKIVAKSSLPISTYLSDISLIGGTIGYFAVNGFWSKVMCGTGAILGNVIFKAFADDSTESVYSSALGIAGVVNNANINSNNNSNNTNINSNNRTTVINNYSNNKVSDEQRAADEKRAEGEENNNNIDPALVIAVIAGLIVVGYTGSYLVSDSSPGLYQYKFYDMYGNKLPMNIEWHPDGSYSLLNHETGEQIECL